MIDIQSLNQTSKLAAEKKVLETDINQRIWEAYVERDLNQAAANALARFENSMHKAASEGNFSFGCRDYYVLQSLLNDSLESDIASCFNEKKSTLAKAGFMSSDSSYNKSYYNSIIESTGCLMALKSLKEQGFKIFCERVVQTGDPKDKMNPQNSAYYISWEHVKQSDGPSCDFNLEIEGLKEEVETLKSMDAMQQKYLELKSQVKALNKEIKKRVATDKKKAGR